MTFARLRIWAAMLLILGLFGAPPGSTAEAYQESPWLRDDVSAGRLPPVGERLPTDPLVVDLKAQGKEIGKPGGTLRMMIGQGSDARSLLPFAYSRLIIYDENYRLAPDILASFDVQDGRIFTFHLREGHRWSDGSPFTTEDFRYYWEDIATNPKLSPDGLPPALLVNGMPPQVEILDQTTIRYTWALPNQAFLPALAAATPLMIYRPARYLKQFNPKYTSSKVITRFLADSKLDDWEDLHQHFDDPLLLGNPDMPTLGPWAVISRSGSQVFAAVRNPYYHRIDKDGQQLPYIDRLVLIPQSKSQILPRRGRRQERSPGDRPVARRPAGAQGRSGQGHHQARPLAQRPGIAARPLSQSQRQGSRLAQLCFATCASAARCRWPSTGRRSTAPSMAIWPSPGPIRCWRIPRSSIPTRRRPGASSTSPGPASFWIRSGSRWTRNIPSDGCPTAGCFPCSSIRKEPTPRRSRCCG